MAIGWVIIGLVLVLVFVFFKFRDLRHKVGLFLMVVFVLFLLFSVGSLYATHDLNLNTFDGVVDAGRLYVVWLGSFGSNIVKISGYAVNQDWNLANSTSIGK